MAQSPSDIEQLLPRLESAPMHVVGGIIRLLSPKQLKPLRAQSGLRSSHVADGLRMRSRGKVDQRSSLSSLTLDWHWLLERFAPSYKTSVSKVQMGSVADPLESSLLSPVVKLVIESALYRSIHDRLKGATVVSSGIARLLVESGIGCHGGNHKNRYVKMLL